MFLDILSSRDIYWQRLWFSIDQDLTNYHSRFNAKNGFIRPGELAYAIGVVNSDFYAFLEQLGYNLTDDERLIRNPNNGHIWYEGKPVVIIKRLGGGKYIVCRTTSWGGHAKVENVHLPVHKYFAFSASEHLGEWPQGVKPLRFAPSLRRSEAIMMIPLVKDDVKPSDRGYRKFLSIGQLERFEALMKLRMKMLPSVIDQLRKSMLEIQMLRRLPRTVWPVEFREKFLKSSILREQYFTSPSSPRNIAVPLHLRSYFGNRVPFVKRLPEGAPVPAIARDRNPPRLDIPKQTNLINWVHGRAVEDFVDSDFHMDPPKPLGKNLKYRIEEHRYREPRISVKGPDGKLRNLAFFSSPEKLIRGGPPRLFYLSSRTFHFLRRTSRSLPLPLL